MEYEIKGGSFPIVVCKLGFVENLFFLSEV